MKGRIPQIIYQFQTFKHWNIFIGDPQGNITQFGYNLSTTVDCQGEKKKNRAVMGNYSFFDLAETNYKIIFCKMSKSDLQHL